MLDEIVKKALLEDCSYQDGDLVLAAVSGGADSMSLLRVVKRLGVPLVAAHFNHHLRQNSNREATDLQALAAEWDIPLVLGEADVKGFACQRHLGLEEAARQCRYQFLFKVAEENGARAILTAHHADDQVETILMHFLRGAGFNGLEGMRPIGFLKQFSKTIPIWRPMLAINKTEILDYCVRNDLNYFTDESNADLTFFRNKLRHTLIPEIEKMAPKFRQTILRNARAIQSANDLLRVGVPEIAKDLDPLIRIDALTFKRQLIIEAPPGKQTKLLKEAILSLEPILRDIGYEKLLELVQKIESGTRKTEIGHGLVMLISGDDVSIQRQGVPVTGYPQLENEKTLELDNLPHVISLKDAYSLFVEILPWACFENLSKTVKTDPNQAFLSFDASRFPLIIQAPRSGMRWQPLGLSEGSQKLSDSFVNAKIPQQARALYPLISLGDEVAWVPGLRIAEPFKLKEKEPQILHLELRQSK